MSLPQTQMTVKEVLKIMNLFASHKVDLWIDGGWGVDALLGRQTREHADLDIAMHHKDVPLIRSVLSELAYRDVPRDDTRDCNFVMGDDQGHEIDFHTFTFDDQGNLTFGSPYPCESLNGTGTIEGQSVRCITPEWMVKFHTGYSVDEDDYHDVKALCEQFGLDMPADYAHFEKN